MSKICFKNFNKILLGAPLLIFINSLWAQNTNIPTFESDMIFWLDIGANEIHRSKSDGSLDTVIVDDKSLNLPDGIAIDPFEGKMYWTNMAPGPNGFLQRANLNGTNIETIIEPGQTHTPKQLKIDFVNKKLYWSDREGGKVQRANFDGSEMEILVSKRSFPVGISIDPVRGKFYWSDKNDGHILRANIIMPEGENSQNRSDIDTLVAGFPDPIDLDLDLQSDYLYWTDRTVGAVLRNPLEFSNGEIAHNRTDIDTLVTGLKDPIGITLDLSLGHMYFTELYGQGVWKSNIDGTGLINIARGKNLVGIDFVKYSPVTTRYLHIKVKKQSPTLFSNYLWSNDPFIRNVLGQKISSSIPTPPFVLKNIF